MAVVRLMLPLLTKGARLETTRGWLRVVLAVRPTGRHTAAEAEMERVAIVGGGRAEVQKGWGVRDKGEGGGCARLMYWWRRLIGGHADAV